MWILNIHYIRITLSNLIYKMYSINYKKNIKNILSYTTDMDIM